jgi:DNA damage-inducible protein 1
MILTVTTDDDRIVTLEVGVDETGENLKAILEVETGIALAEQRLICNGKEITNQGTLAACGVSENDLVMLARQPAAQSASNSQAAPGNQLALNTDGSAVNPEEFKVRIIGFIVHLFCLHINVFISHEAFDCNFTLRIHLDREPARATRCV